MTPQGEIRAILEMARWAPSGDNTQPWRFEVNGERRLTVHGFDTREHCVYDLDGHPSQISLGALLETMEIAASSQNLRMIAARRENCADSTPMIDVDFVQDEHLETDPLFSSIIKRSVQRRRMGLRPLTEDERHSLQNAVGNAYNIQWFESLGDRLAITRLLFSYAKLRLTMPEAYLVHRDVIEWAAQYSENGVPDQALGIDPITLRLMRFVMRRWGRVRFFNTFLAGTWAPRLQMELVPGLACAAHYSIVARAEPVTIDDYIAAGRAMQRFWLTATSLGLAMQPELTPLIFSRYSRNEVQFSCEAELGNLAKRLSNKLEGLLDCRRSVFLGRIGSGPEPRARSTRKSVDELVHRAGRTG